MFVKYDSLLDLREGFEKVLRRVREQVNRLYSSLEGCLMDWFRGTGFFCFSFSASPRGRVEEVKKEEGSQVRCFWGRTRAAARVE